MSKQARLIAKKIREAKRPLILIGNGVRLSGGISALRRVLLRLLNKRLKGVGVVSAMFTADDILPDYPHYLGCQGMWGRRGANEAIDNCDLLLILGASMSLTQTSYDYKNFATQAYTIMVDIDPAVLKKKTLEIDMPICGDVKEFLEELMNELS